METISKEFLENFVQSNCFELSSTQIRLSIPIIKRIAKKMELGIRFQSIGTFDKLIIDGHHRYIASLLTNYPIERVPSQRTSGIQIIEWSMVEFVDDDYDTLAKINMLNKRDASFNGMSLEKLIDLINNS
ncbi:MAG: hypothetical protein ACOVP1_04430 [Bacteroidia bacterium]